MARRAADPVPRKAPKQERATLTIEAIVTAVERVLEKHGAAGLTTNRVAEIAGVSVGTLYQWFPNKEALVGSLQERYLAQTMELCRAALRAAEGVPLDSAIRAVSAALVRAFHTQRPIERWLIELRSAAAFQQRWRDVFDALADDVGAFLARHPDADVEDPAATSFVLVHALEGVVEAVGARRPNVDIEVVARATERMVRRAVLRPG
jgi:AcrR family transcriptional regulator